MKIVLVGYLDIAGQSSILWKGLKDYTNHDARFIKIERTYLSYEEDIYYPTMREEAHEVMDQANVFHISEGIPKLEGYNLTDKLSEIPFVQELHGTYAGMNWQMLLARWFQHSRVYVTHLSTAMVREKIGFSIYIPRSVDFREFPKPRRDPQKIRIAHCPTNRTIKATDFFLEIMNEIEKEYPYVETVLVENKSWKDCLNIKATCDLVFDHLGKVEQGYGLNSIEAMVFGIPALCKVRNYTYIHHPDCPIVNTMQETLKDQLIKLIEDDDLRTRIGKQGVKYMQRVHDVKKNVKKWEAMYNYVIHGKQ
jgi:glycosyltransferase involved in cell wall biosynthesis